MRCAIAWRSHDQRLDSRRQARPFAKSLRVTLRVLNLTLQRPFGTDHGRAVVRENQKRLRSLHAKCLPEMPAKSAAQAVDDLKSVPRLNIGCHRSAVLHAAFHERPVLPNRDANGSAAVLEGVSRCIRYKLVGDHSQAPAT